MANITSEHLHHLARRHHATMKKLDAVTGRFADFTKGLRGTLEYGAGTFVGGALEGRTGGMALGPLPINLGIGIALVAFGHFGGSKLDQVRDDLNHLGNGFIGSYVAATGYAFGKRWKDSGKMFGGGGHPWTQPYDMGTTTSGDLSQAQMAAIIQRMQRAQQAPAQR